MTTNLPGTAGSLPDSPAVVRDDCRHYSTRTTASGDIFQRCRLDANEPMPFACPDHCVFFEPRKLSDQGWLRVDRPDDDDPPDEG
jgi:hypothetical protein